MNTIKSLLVTVALVAAIHTQGAATLTGPAKAPPAVTAPAASTPGLNLELSLEPYAALSWQGLNGHSQWGAGISPALALTKNLSLVGYFESDNVNQEFVDRVSGGLRYTAYLGKVLSLDAGVGLGYATELDQSFIRLPLGANINILRSGNADIYLRGEYVFDVDGNGKEGRATGRVFLGPVLSLKF